MMIDTKISCIVPVFNEADRVLEVLNVLVGHKLLDEVIVVNDGSTDNSENVLKGVEGIKLISYKRNRGKSHAIKVGIEASKNDLVMMIDSDLLGLRKDHVARLVNPVKNGIVDSTMALWSNSLLIFKLFGFDLLSGNRVFSKDIIGDLNKLDELSGFGLEVFLNNVILGKKLRLCVVNFDNVISVRKAVKFGFFDGWKREFKMSYDIFKTIGFYGLIKQFFKIKSVIKRDC